MDKSANITLKLIFEIICREIQLVTIPGSKTVSLEKLKSALNDVFYAHVLKEVMDMTATLALLHF